MEENSKIDQYLNEYRAFELGQIENLSLARIRLYKFIRLCLILWHEIDETKLFTRASSLVYTSMLSLIPLLVVAGSLILAFNQDANREQLIDLIREYVIPVAGNDVTTFLIESLDRTMKIGTGPVGGVALLVTSVMLFLQIEESVNDSWHIKKQRSIVIRVMLFYMIVTLGPILLSISVYQVKQVLGDFSSNFYLRILVSILSSAFVLFGLYQFFPNARVHWKTFAVIALGAAVCFEILKFGFTFYITATFSSKFTILYGALGLIPVMLLWIYLVWLLILFGSMINYCVQNYNMLKQNRYLDTSKDATWTFLSAYAPLEVIACMVRAFDDGRLPLSAEKIAVICNYPSDAVNAILSRLQDRSFVKLVEEKNEPGYIFSSDPGEMDLQKMFDIFGYNFSTYTRYPTLKALIDNLKEAEDAILEHKCANDLREKKD